MLKDLRLRTMFDPTQINSNIINNNIPQLPQLPGPNMPNGPIGGLPQTIGPEFPINMNNPPVVPPGIDLNQSIPIQDKMQSMYSPETAASSRLNELLAGYPEREKPGMLKKIIASIATLGPNGIKAQDEILNGGFNDRLEDWKNKVVPAQNAAQLERQANAASESAFNTRADNTRQDKNLERLNKVDAERTKLNDAKNTLAQKKYDLDKFKAENPHMKFQTDETGMVIALNPVTGKGIPTGINSGDMSDMDKIRYGLDAALTKIGASGVESRLTEEARQTNRLTNAENADVNTKENISLRGDQARTTRAASTSSQIAKGDTPSQTKIRRQNNAASYARQNPEAAKYIKIDKSGNVIVEAPGTGFFGGGPPPEIYNAIIAAVDAPGDTVVNNANISITPKKKSLLANVPSVKPKKGDKKTFPNGRKATHDGISWVQDQ